MSQIPEKIVKTVRGYDAACTLSGLEDYHSVDELLRTAITQRRQIRFRYGGTERVAEPHDYGIQNGKARLLAYQTSGRSNSGPLPAWRLVDVSGMTQLELLEKTFPGNRPAPSGRRQQWERLFLRVGEPPQSET